MKKVIFSLVFVLGLSAISFAQSVSFKNITNNTLDFGTVNQNANGDRYVQIKNTGTQPLIIKNVSSSCGCTVPEWPKTPIAPGKIAKIKVHYNTAIVGSISKTVTIQSNDATNQNIILKIVGNVVKPQ